MTEERDGPDTLRVPFIFVKHGDPEPREWMARHPGWVKIPAVMIPRRSRHHPANGGPNPTFDAAPARPVTAAVPDEEQWPLGKPVAATLRRAMSRLHPGGQPPRYPGGLGAPPGSPGSGDPVAAYLRASAAVEPGRLSDVARKHVPASKPAVPMPEARERAFLHLVRWMENEGETDDEA